MWIMSSYLDNIFTDINFEFIYVRKKLQNAMGEHFDII